MLTNEELVKELIRIRFSLMRVNGVLQSERRPNHVLEVAQQLIDEEIRRIAPEVEGSDQG